MTHVHKLCGKRVWKSLTGAKREAKKLTEKLGKTYRPYQCDKCGQFHLSSKGLKRIKSNLDLLSKKRIGKIKNSLKSLKNGKLE